MQVLYTASATATGGRAGHVRSAEGALDFDLAWPTALGGAGGAGTNPEELFAAGYAACFAQALVRAARDRGVALGGPPAVTAEVGVGRRENGRLNLAVALRASLPGVERTQAEALVALAHEEICPYSRATRGNIDVQAMVE
jgi:Ohr subfamily peroxiredoxin